MEEWGCVDDGRMDGRMNDNASVMDEQLDGWQWIAIDNEGWCDRWIDDRVNE